MLWSVKHTRAEWCIVRTEPTQTDSTYQQVWIDTLTNFLADDATPIERRTSINVLNLPLDAQDWAREQGLLRLNDLAPRSNHVNGENQLALVSPHPNTVYHIDPGSDLSIQQLQIEVAAAEDVSEITIWVDANPLYTLSSQPFEACWTLAEGKHQFWAKGLTVNGDKLKSEIVTIQLIK